MLVIQRITTHWTKATRGGEGARRRNAIPEAIQLPPLTTKPSYVLHEVESREEQDFRSLNKWHVEDDLPRHMQLPPLFIDTTPEAISLRFIWSWDSCGAPERASQSLFSLVQGEWRRFRINGRFGATSGTGSEWTYHKSVFNIAFAVVYDPVQFVASYPGHSQDCFAVLW